MALCTQILRDGENLKLPHGWGWWHVECMLRVVRDEVGAEAGLQQLDRHVVLKDHTFTDPDDGEVLTLKPGDQLVAYRDR